MLMTMYRDFSGATMDPLLDTVLSGTGCDEDRYFPLKLHKMISEAEIGGFSNVISWQAHGRSFIIHDNHKFVKEILPL